MSREQPARNRWDIEIFWEIRRKVQKNEGADRAIGGHTGTFCKDRAGHALLSDCSTNERSAFIAVPPPFRGDEDRIGGSAISNQEHQVSPRGASDWWRGSVRKSVSVHQDKTRGSAIGCSTAQRRPETARFDSQPVLDTSHWYCTVGPTRSAPKCS